MTTTISQIPTQIDDMVDWVNTLPTFDNVHYENSLSGFKTKLHQIRLFHNVEKYKIAFIGTPGRGKTTAICNWLGLIKSDKSNVSMMKDLCLLSTGSGRTTVAEVHIDQIDGVSNFELEYVSMKQQEEYIRTYCKFFFDKINEIVDDTSSDLQESSSSDDNTAPYAEIDRVIRNMANLPDVSDADIAKKSATYQKALAAVKDFENYEQFAQVILKRVNLEDRQARRLVYNNSNSFEAWLSDEFKKINNGENPHTSIVERIYIHISKNDFNLHLPSFVKEVIDTKGLDTSARLDILELMQAPDTICFILDDFNSMPTQAVRQIIHNSFTCANDLYLVKKSALFINADYEALVSVNESENDTERGKAIKLNELSRRIQADCLRYECANTLFIDIASPYNWTSTTQKKIDKKTGKLEISRIRKLDSYDIEIANNVVAQINDHLSNIIVNLNKLLEKDALNIRNALQSMIKDAKLEEDKAVKAELDDVKESICSLKQQYAARFPKSLSQEVVDAAVGKIHWRTVRKMNECYGGYQQWHTNIFDEIRNCGRELFMRDASKIEDEIKHCLHQVNHQRAKNLVKGFIETLEAETKKQEDMAGKDFFNLAYYDKFHPQSSDLPFWNEVIAIHGQGYRKNVIAYYNDYLQQTRTDEEIWRILLSREMHLFDSIINLL